MRSNKILLSLVILFPFVFLSCSDTFLPALKVKSFDYDSSKITVEFSENVLESSVQKSFSLTEDSQSVNGVFSFNGCVVQFFPESGIKENYDYVFCVSTDCEDKNYCSLSKKFVKEFSTRKDKTSPEILSVTMEDTETLENNAVVIEFSKRIDEISFFNSISVSPSFEYFTFFEDAGKTVKLVPLEKLLKNTDYKITISTDLMDCSRNYLKEKFIKTFSLVKKYEAPEIKCSIFNADNDGQFIIDSVAFEASENGENVLKAENVSLNSTIRFNFNEKMSFEGISGEVDIFPVCAYSLTKDEINSKWFEVKLKDAQWGKTYRICLSEEVSDVYSNKTGKENILSVSFDREEERPPEFIEGYLQISSFSEENYKDSFKVLSSSTDYDYLIFDSAVYESGAEVESILYLVFASSNDEKNEGINVYSLLDRFSITASNSCAGITIKKIEVADEEIQTFPLKNIITSALLQSKQKLSVVKCTLCVKNNANRGIVQFNLESGFTDLLGNVAVKGFELKFNK